MNLTEVKGCLAAGSGVAAPLTVLPQPSNQPHLAAKETA